MPKFKETTATFLVQKALREAEDFLSIKMLCAATGRPYNQVNAALHHLRKSQVADVVVNADGTGWWFALPSEEDLRSRTMEERAPELKRRRPRTKKK